MGFNFRKSLKIAPGIRLNITKNGISSVSLGGKCVRINRSKKRTRIKVSVPSAGLSYSTFSTKQIKKETVKREPVNSSSIQMDMSQVKAEILPLNMSPVRAKIPPLPSMPRIERKVSILLGIGIFLMPYIFAWFTLRKGYSKLARFISFGWLLLLVFAN